MALKSSGCARCPVREWCEAGIYQGSSCAARRARAGLGDPRTIYDALFQQTPDELARTNLLHLPECDDPEKNRCRLFKKDCSACRLDWILSCVDQTP